MPDVKHFDPDAALEQAMRVFWQRGAAATGIQDIVTATGLNRSSLYGSFGNKRELYLAALRRYAEERAELVFRAMARDERGIAAIEEFFDGLITARCSGPYARWGCMVTNASAAGEAGDPDIGAVLELQHERLVDSLRSALTRASDLGQLGAAVSPAESAQVLALIAYGVNLRSRTGADAHLLRRTVGEALDPLRASAAGGR
ncbi:TetR/AcrR family transcriptional regulator [Streptomyces sp. NPDC007818]|uniref:TetR/AcrR family transcriptional regulator n=1 Tax=Streptomyces sp. NPDC007818 TaxID=3364780 RepID=UPI0036771E1D